MCVRRREQCFSLRVREELPSDKVSQNIGNDNAGLLAAVLFGLNANMWWLLLILILLLIAYLIYRRYKSDK